MEENEDLIEKDLKRIKDKYGSDPLKIEFSRDEEGTGIRLMMRRDWKKKHLCSDEECEKQFPITDEEMEAYLIKDRQIAMERGNLPAGTLSINNFVANVNVFYKINPFFYDRSKIFWFWNKKEFKYEIVDEVDLMNMLDKHLGFLGQTVTNSVKNNYIEAFKRVGRQNHPKEAPTKWIQFKDKAYSINSGETHKVTPEYFFTNPIPIELGTITDTPIMDKLFNEWCGMEGSEQLFELLAYSTYREYPIQLLFCLYGNGRNGKSQFLRVLDKFVGSENCATTELQQLLENRFESFRVYKKLVCCIGETNFNILTRSSLIKKLVGGDKISFEKKNKDPFEGYNYAKIIIASNSLPSSDDTSDGFYRRWLIIDFPNEFEENGRDVWKDIPEKEYSNLAFKCCLRLRDLLESGKFTNQGTIQERKEKYIMASNPLSLFVKARCEVDFYAYESYNRLYTAYVGYLAEHKKRKVKMKEFRSVLEDEGFTIEKNSKKVNDEFKSGFWVEGLKLCDKYDNCDTNPTQLHTHESRMGVRSYLSQLSQENIVKEELVSESVTIFHKCTICGQDTSTQWLPNGKPVCDDCYKGIQIQNKP